ARSRGPQSPKDRVCALSAPPPHQNRRRSADSRSVVAAVAPTGCTGRGDTVGSALPHRPDPRRPPDREGDADSGVRTARDVSIAFPPGFFDRVDPSPDPVFYRPLRLVTHIDDDAIAAVGALYDELGIDGEVLDLMSSWVSHFNKKPGRLTVLGMN